MPNTIRIKRRPSSGAAGEPTSLFNGELAFNENDNILYYGFGSGVGGAGVATSRPPIAGSGYYAHRGGTNASGTWPINVTGSAGSVPNAVYTTGNQTISGIKTLTNNLVLNGSETANVSSLRFNGSDGTTVYFDPSGNILLDRTGNNLLIDNNTNGLVTIGGSTIQLDGSTQIIAANTASNSVGYFAVFDSNPSGSLTTLKSVSKDQILDDIGAATSGLDITAGSGLVGGGTLSQNRRFDIGQGDGIAVSADSIAVDNTVVRTTGNQDINGAKSFYDSTSGNVILTTADNIVRIKAPNSNDTIYYFLGLDGGGSPPSSTIAERSTISRSTSQVKSDIGLSNVQNLALSGITFSAGDGLSGGGNLSENRTFTVDGTVVRTASGQTIAGVKTFTNTSIFGSGIIASGTNAVQAASTASTATQFAVFTSSPNSSAQTVFTRTPSEVKTDIGLSNVTNDAQIKKVSSVTSGNIPFWNGTTGDLLANGYGVETLLTGSSSNLPRADAVKTYVDSMIGSGIATNDAMIFKGALDCSTNPNYPAADRGWTYKVSVAGKIGGASGPVVEVNDTLICTTDGTSAGTHAVVGSNWVILQTNIVDASILVTGPASATSGNIAMFDGSTGKAIKDGGFLASNIVLTTGNQTIGGSKTFISPILANTGIIIGDLANYLTGTGLLINYGDGGGILTSFVNAASPSNNSINLNANTTFNNVEGTAALPFIISPTGYVGSGAITQGFWRGSTVEVDKGGTGQTSYTNGQLLIGNTTGNTLTKATLTAGTSVDITNGNGSITIGHADTSTLTGAQGSNGIASITVDGLGHVTAVTTATYLTAGTVCAAIVDCTLDGGSF